MASARDPGDVRDGDETILRLFVAARAAGDGQAVARLWAELLTLNFDRVEQLVYLESHDRLSRQVQEDALQLALLRLAMIPRRRRGFEGTTKGEWVEFSKRVVRAACIDTQRREVRHSERRAGLHTTDEEGQERLTKEAYEAILKEEDERDDDRELRRELGALSDEFFDWALPQMSESHRKMIECDRQGMSTEKIIAKLGKKTRDAVYKLRERAMKALMKLREEYKA